MLKKLKKGLVLICISLFCGVIGMIFVSCSDKKPDTTDSSNNVEYVLELKDETVTVGVGESIELLIDSYNGERTIQWSSSNDLVATVADGVVKGLSVGVATITAQAGTAQATCMVFVKGVIANEDTPTVQISLNKDSLYVGENASVQVEIANVSVSATNISFEYLVSNEDIIEVDTVGNITAKAEGTSSLTVKAAWEGGDISKTIAVVVKPDYEVVFDKQIVSLVAIAEWNDETYENTCVVNASVKYRGQLQENLAVTWETSDASVVTAVDGMLQGIKVGEAIVKANYVKDGRTYWSEIPVYVEPALIGLVSDTIAEFPINTSYEFTDIPYYDEIPGNIQQVSILINGLKYELASSNDSAFQIPENFSSSKIEILVETDLVNTSFFVDAFIALYDYEDLALLKEKGSGYFKLMSDIDMPNASWSYENRIAFSGIFDGNGYEIKGMKIDGENGLFCQVENEVVITNLTLSDVVINSSTITGALFSSDKDVNTQITVKDVQVNVLLPDGVVCGGLFGKVRGQVFLENVVVSAHQLAQDTTAGGAIFGTFSGKLTAKNVTIYSSLWHTTSSEQPTTPNGIRLVAPSHFIFDNAEVKLNFLSAGNEYDLQADLVQIYYLGEIQTSASGFTIDDDLLLKMGGKNVEIVVTKGNEKEYYYIPVASKGYINQENFYKIANVTDGEIYLEENIDFSLVENWTNAASGKFTGVFDGQGFTISNFTGMLFYDFYGTAKNFDLIDAKTIKASQGLICYTMRPNSRLENVSIVAKLGYYEKSGVLTRQLLNGVQLVNVNIFATSTRTSDTGFLAGFGTKAAYVDCTNCLFVVTDEKGSFAPCGIRTGSYFNTIEEMGEGYSKVLRGDFRLYNRPDAFIKAYNENTLSDNDKAVYENKFKAIMQREVKEVKNLEDLTAMLSGDASYYYLTKDIDCTGVDWSNVERDQVTYFEVIVEGNEHCINGLPSYLFYRFQGRLQNIAFTNMQEGASICQVARGGALMNVFLHGAVVRGADGGLFATEINANKASGSYYLRFDNVMIMTTNRAESGYNQGSIAGYAVASNNISCNNVTIISRCQPITTRHDKNNSGAYKYVSDLGDGYTNFLKDDFSCYDSANLFETSPTTLSSLNQKYYNQTKVLEEEIVEVMPDYSGDAVVFDSTWNK